MAKPSRLVPKKKQKEEGERENVGPQRRVERKYSPCTLLGDESRALNTQPSSLEHPPKRKTNRNTHLVTPTPQRTRKTSGHPPSSPRCPPKLSPKATQHPLPPQAARTQAPLPPNFPPPRSPPAVVHVESRNVSPTPCQSILFQSSVAGYASGRNTPDTLNMPAFTHPNSPYVPWSSPIRRQICRPFFSSESVDPRPSVSVSTRTRSGARAPEPTFTPPRRKLVTARLSWGLKALQSSMQRKMRGAAKKLRRSRADQWRKAGVADQHVTVPTWSDGSTMSLESVDSASLEEWLASRNSHDEGPEELLEDDDCGPSQEDGTLASVDHLDTPVDDCSYKAFMASTSTYGSLLPRAARRFTAPALEVLSTRSRSPSPLGRSSSPLGASYRSRSPSPLGMDYRSRSPSPLGIAFRPPSCPLPALPSVDELSVDDGIQPSWAEVSPTTQYLRVPSASTQPRGTDSRPVSWRSNA
ncbi:uncharacterized protein SCHCODRAFT_02486592 [Schizophyllum commune H4-8]|uniref:uncharacterized protein n=1 Tax=Schizophyllum commune (strain H4-8 / FGSC 9210) TaxID=578458 RepID=UPI0021602FCC|nr:uncharacterized protein SCHCODRAFT_02486592 [Schizophyllum commune H4-8]KAI5897748.1 hypothetical protein SCHCODRAFT_02486592 [Schizophyllum commune H4-8]